jgi:hypothetical protein
VPILSSQQRTNLENACTKGRRAAEQAVRAALTALDLVADRPPDHLHEYDRHLRRGLRTKARQLGDQGGNFDSLVSECAYEQWHRLLFARFLAENNLLIHPEYRAPVTLDDCSGLAEYLGEPDGWSVAGRFAAQILPGIFQPDDPCVRLRLAPEGRLSLEGIVAGLPAEVFACDDSLGWVYQFWQKDKKDEVNASERKIGGADLGPVTQLFTENYMVRFLLHNSLGAWWASRYPDSPLIKTFGFLRFDEDGRPVAGDFEDWPDQVAHVTVLDPCCGSGHFLVEAFSMLWQMRAEEEGIKPPDAQDAVLRDNLFGLELDPRCVQIAMYAVALQAWKAGGCWRQLPVPNIACSGIPVKTPEVEWKALALGDSRLETSLLRLHGFFREADTLGSLIDPSGRGESKFGSPYQPSLDDLDWQEVAPTLVRALKADVNQDVAAAVLGADVRGLVRAADFLVRPHTLVATNVPFLSRSKQSDTLRNYLDLEAPLSKGDLATAMLERWMRSSLTIAAVTPQNWQENPGYTEFRKEILRGHRYDLFARVGNNVWQTQSSRQPYKVPTILSILSSAKSENDHSISALDIGNGPVRDKPQLLTTESVVSVMQRDQLRNPDSRVVMAKLSSEPLLATVATAKQGIKTGDDPRYRRFHWEVVLPQHEWVYLQSSLVSTQPYGGRSSILRWEGGSGTLVSSKGARIQGQDAWSRRGVLVSQMGELFATLYTGERFDSNGAAVIPASESDLPALWALLSSPEYRQAVRAIDNNVKVTNKTLVKVSVDMNHWRKVADEEDPLPEPWSNDPTQWLFNGRPETSTSPLQVALARLVGYRWPEQPQFDNLDEFADADGIVCIPSVAGERPAADRLEQALTAAFGGAWSQAVAVQMLEATTSRKRSLGDWLRDDFFKQHCALFEDRPFVWHIWDGLRDGFAALVNYHRLDRKTLEKLAFTYLGDWIERQRAGVREDVPGADVRLTAATSLRSSLELILDGEPPYDIYARWKALAEQPIGWDPDINDGVRVNVRPFVSAGALRSPINIHWRKDRGKEPDGSDRPNDLHFTLAQKNLARGGAE